MTVRQGTPPLLHIHRQLLNAGRDALCHQHVSSSLTPGYSWLFQAQLKYDLPGVFLVAPRFLPTEIYSFSLLLYIPIICVNDELN